MSANPRQAHAFVYPDHDVEMALIRTVCEAEDAARVATAPYNTNVTTEQLQQVQLQLSEVLGQQLARGRHVRMDVILSLRQKLGDVNERLVALTRPEVVPPPAPDVLV